MLSTLLKSMLLASMFLQGNSSKFKNIQVNHKHSTMTFEAVRYLAGLSDTKYTNTVLDHILIPRVVGTSNHKIVFDYIKSQLDSLSWDVEVDRFEDNTPVGPKNFRNIIATLDPTAERFLVLACHYDSKSSEFMFVGATDSAVPCAMMLNLIKVMDKELKSTKGKADVSLKLIFFDGEEAFERWGPNDSLYGAKHLAKVLENKKHISRLSAEEISDIEKIDLLILLDLIGHKETRFLSCFENSQKWFLHLNRIEETLSVLNLLDNYKGDYFIKRKYTGYIEDDHIPFLQRNVPILHLISIPFPKEWHTTNDDRTLIDYHLVENLNKILRVFVAEYLHIEIEDTASENIPPKEL